MTTDVREFDYECSAHGTFVVSCDVLLDDPWQERECPQCSELCPRAKIKKQPGAPFIKSMVPIRGYYSRNLGRFIRNERDVREAQRMESEFGHYPMSDRDLRDAEDDIAARDRQGKADLKAWENEQAANPEDAFDESPGRLPEIAEIK